MENDVIVDTNALMLPFQKRLDIEGNLAELLGTYRILVPESVIRELESLSKVNPDARAALAYSKKFDVLNTEMEGDLAILHLALERKCYVLTNDSELIKRLKRNGIRVIRPRGEKRLVIA